MEEEKKNENSEVIIDENDIEVIDAESAETPENTEENDEKDNEIYGNNLKTIKDIAKECGLQYETIRKKVQKHEDELGGHIVRDAITNTRYLDQFAQDFILGKTAKKYIKLADTTAKEEAAMWHDKYIKISEEYTEILKKNAELVEKTARLEVLEEKEKTYLLQIEKSKELEKEIEDKSKENTELVGKTKDLESQVKELKAENEKFVPYKTLFGKTRYKKVED